MATFFPFAEYWWLYAAFTGGVLLLLFVDLFVLHRDDDGLRAELDLLRAAGVRVFLDLTEGTEWGLRPYDGFLDGAASYRRYAIQDFGCPTVEGMRDILDAIDGALGRGANVYVHCYAGIGRTGTVVGCYLVRHGMSAGEAMQTTSRGRGIRSPQSVEQEEFVLAWRAGS